MKFTTSALLSSLWLIAVPAGAVEMKYPYPVHYMSLNIEGQPVKMAYMDVRPENPNGKTILFFHGKNFNGFYWKDVIPSFTQAGYRVIAPDQVGWGKSSKPNLHYSFYMLALNNKLLLDSLGIDSVIVAAHSMGGMLGTRFSLMYPERVSKLILENIIGLEDYASFVPYRTLVELYQNELKATYESYKNYQKSYYPVWKEDYEPLVMAQAEALDDANFKDIAWANALTYQMIYEQPVVYEFDKLSMPVLILIGQLDRTIVGKNLLTETQKQQHGNYPEMGLLLNRRIKNSKLVELPGVGHIPHMQIPGVYAEHVLSFLSK